MVDKELITREILEIVLNKYIRIDSYKIDKLFCDRCNIIVINSEIDVENEEYTAGTCLSCGVTLCLSCQSLKHCDSCQDVYCKFCFGSRDYHECIQDEVK